MAIGGRAGGGYVAPGVVVMLGEVWPEQSGRCRQRTPKGLGMGDCGIDLEHFCRIFSFRIGSLRGERTLAREMAVNKKDQDEMPSCTPSDFDLLIRGYCCFG